MFQRLLQGEMPPLYELRVRSRSGGYVVGEFRSTPQLRAGMVAGVLGVVRDITARKQAEDALRYRQEFENLLTAIATHFINLAIEEIDRGISQALKTIGEFAGVDRSYIFLFSDDGATMSNTHEWCADGVESYIEQLQGLPVDTFSWVLQPIRRFETIQIPRVADLPPEAAVEKEEFQREGIQSLISVPLVYGGSVIGFLGFDSVRAEKTWTEDSISLLKIAGEMLVNALARKRAEEVLRRRTEQLAALHEIDLEISAERDLTQLLDIVVQRTAGLLAASKYSIYIYDDDRAALRIAASLDEHFIGISLREGEGLAGRVAVTGQPLAVEDYMQWEGKAAVFDAEGFGPALAAPLKWQGTVLGVLSLARNRGERSFSPDDMDILEQVAAQAAIALHQARLFEEVRAARERLQTLSRRLIEVQEMERRTIARELHDEIGQALTAVKINLQAVQRLPDAAAFAPRLEDSMSIIERTLQQVRTLSLDLRPSMLDDLGLVSALRWYVDRQAQRTGVVAQFTADPLDARLPPELETTCFRVAQEALTNVARHAQARHVNVRLRQREAELELVVEDDGSGFDVPAARARAARGVSMGLLGMEERVLLVGGRIDITSAPGRGTEVRARFPLKEITA
jgi:signal transduction histidine kinase